jgi:CRP-like cAMP-binding protein
MDLSLSLEQVIEFLLDTLLFEALAPNELADVVQIMQIQRFRPDQTILAEGDVGDAWFVIHEGKADVIKTNPFTPKRIVATLESHACFGEMAVLDGSPRSASVVAQTDVTVFRFPRSPFQGLLEEGNLAAYKLVHGMAGTLCQRQRNLNQKLTDLIEEQETDALGLRSRVGPLLDATTISE